MWAAIDRLQRVGGAQEAVNNRRSEIVDACGRDDSGSKVSCVRGNGWIPGRRGMGAIGSSVFILLPGTLIVDCRMCVTFAASENPALASVQRYVGLGVIGLLAGNAVRMFIGEGIERDSILFGLLISLGIPVYVVLNDGSLIIAACAGLALGSLTIRGDRRSGSADVE